MIHTRLLFYPMSLSRRPQAPTARPTLLPAILFILLPPLLQGPQSACSSVLFNPYCVYLKTSWLKHISQTRPVGEAGKKEHPKKTTLTRPSPSKPHNTKTPRSLRLSLPPLPHFSPQALSPELLLNTCSPPGQPPRGPAPSTGAASGAVPGAFCSGSPCHSPHTCAACCQCGCGGGGSGASSG